MNIKELTYQERLQLLKNIFDTTNIVLTGAYGAVETIIGKNISIVSNIEEKKDKNGGRPYCRNDFSGLDDINEPELIVIHTGICTG